MRLPSLAARIATVAVLTAAASFARAGSTDPTLAIGQVVAYPAGSAALVEVTGILGFDDLVQVDFPLNLVVFQGTGFTRYPVGGAAESGTLAGLTDGLQTSELTALESAGSPEPNAEIVRLEPNRLLVSVPPAIASGTVTAILYVELPGEGSFVSNSVSTSVGGSGGGSP